MSAEETLVDPPLYHLSWTARKATGRRSTRSGIATNS